MEAIFNLYKKERWELSKQKTTQQNINWLKTNHKLNILWYIKTGPGKKVTIYFPIFYLVKSSENNLFFYLHFTWLFG